MSVGCDNVAVLRCAFKFSLVITFYLSSKTVAWKYSIKGVLKISKSSVFSVIGLNLAALFSAYPLTKPNILMALKCKLNL